MLTFFHKNPRSLVLLVALVVVAGMSAFTVPGLRPTGFRVVPPRCVRRVRSLRP